MEARPGSRAEMGVMVKQMCQSLGCAEVGSTFSVGQERGAQMHCVVLSRSYHGSAAMSRSNTGLVARPGNTSLSVVIPCKSWETMGVPMASRKMSPCRASDVVVGCCLGQQCRGGMQTAETGLPLCHGLTSLFHCSSLFLLSRLFTDVEVLCADPLSGPVQRAVKMIADRWRMKQEGCSPPRQSDRTGQPGWDRTEMEASYTSSRPIRCVVLLHPMWKVKGRYILATVQKA